MFRPSWFFAALLVVSACGGDTADTDTGGLSPEGTERGNSAPTIDTPDPLDLGARTSATVTLTGIGPGQGTDEAGQTVTLAVAASNPSLFTQLELSPPTSDGTAELRITVAPNVHGLSDLTLTLDDGQAENHQTTVTFAVLVNEARPSVRQVTAPASASGGCVSIGFRLLHPTSIASTVGLEFDAGKGFQPATLQTASGQEMTASPAGVAHNVVWRSNVDLPGASNVSVRLRVTPFRGPFAGEATVIENLRVNTPLRFSEPQKYPTGPGPFAAVVADVNRDGIPDVVSPDSYTNTVSLMLGRSGGGFEAPRSLAVADANCGGGSPKPFSVGVVDQNRDGWPDFIAVIQNCEAIGVVLSDGRGGYLPYRSYAVGAIPLFGASDDFNGDGNLDLAVVNYVSNDVSLLLGNSSGGFQAQVRLPTPVNPNKIVLGDMDGDGRMDLVTANAGSNNFSILYGDGAGHFPNRKDFAAGVGPRNLGVGDFNGDGRLDVVTANPGPADNATSSTVMLQTASGFAAPVEYRVETHPRSVAVADVNGDGVLDIGIGNVASNSVSILLGHGDGTFSPAVNLAAGNGVHSTTFHDMNGDGVLDLVTGNTNEGSFSVLINQVAVCSP